MTTAEFAEWFLRLDWGGRLAIHRFDKAESTQLLKSRGWPGKSTFVRPHKQFHGIKSTAVCLISFKEDEGYTLYLAVSKNKRAVATTETRITLSNCHRIAPNSFWQIPYARSGKKSLKRFEYSPTIVPTSTESRGILRDLLALESNRFAFEEVARVLQDQNKVYESIRDIQQNSIDTALGMAGLERDQKPVVVDVPKGETSLENYRLLEDNVIIHDAHTFPDMDRYAVEPTGRVRFASESVLLDVITANKQPLESTFGVDLIFVNHLFNSVVMVQYKMLEPVGLHNDSEYRFDAQFNVELTKMLAVNANDSQDDYRLNSDVCYVKFVRRRESTTRYGFVLPINQILHFSAHDLLLGPKGGRRFRSDSFGPRYLSHDAFCDLVRRGYVGSCGDHSQWLQGCIETVLKSGRALTLAQLFARNSSEGQ